MGSCISFCQDQPALGVDGAVPRPSAGQGLFRVLPVASWMAVSRSLCVSVALLALLCSGALLSGVPAKTSALVTVVVIFHINIPINLHRKAFAPDKRQIHKEKPKLP